MKGILILALGLAGAVAAPIIEFNTNTLRVVAFQPRANTPLFFGRSDVLVIAPPSETNIPLPKIERSLVPTNFFANPAGFEVQDRTNLVAVAPEVLLAEANAQAEAAALANDAALREQAKAPMSAETAEAVALRATVSVLVDEINALRGELNQAKTNAAAWRNAPVLPLRTLQQAKTAIVNRVEDGGAR